MQEKFEKLFYEFKPEDVKGIDWLHSPQAYFRGEKSLPDSTLNAGFQVITAPVNLEFEPHFHREDEYHIILGAKLPDVFSSFDAEVHFFMGKTVDSMEKIVVTEPTVIKVPKYWCHSSLNFVRIDKPVFYQPVLLAGREGRISVSQDRNGKDQYIYSEDELLPRGSGSADAPAAGSPWTAVNEDGVASYSDPGAYDPSKAPLGPDCVIMPGYESKPYSDATKLKAPKPPLSPEVSKCVLAAPKEETNWGAWCPSPQFYFRGEIYMQDATYHVNYQIFTAANDMEDSHIHQGAEEYIFFMGADPMNIFDFDAEIEMFFGDDPEHLESRIINKPTVVRIPANVWHCPLKFRKMNKPIIFQAAFVSGTWGTINQVREEKAAAAPEEETDARPFARTRTYTYMGDNVRFCKYNLKKRCIICGACFPKPENYLTEE